MLNLMMLKFHFLQSQQSPWPLIPLRAIVQLKFN